MVLLALLLCGDITQRTESVTVDMVELNYCYNSGGELRFTQYIYWGKDGNLPVVHHWEIVGDKRHRVAHNKDLHYPFRFFRIKGSSIVIIRTKKYKITHTTIDPEEQNRSVRPVNQRERLFDGNN